MKVRTNEKRVLVLCFKQKAMRGVRNVWPAHRFSETAKDSVSLRLLLHGELTIGLPFA